MKRTFKSAIYIIVWMCAATISVAQEQITKRNKSPRWVSEKGFWQIESNINSPEKSTVYFYNNENALVYKEHVEGIVLDLNKRRVKMRLKNALETALLSWSNKRVPKNDQQWISMQFKKN
jgi:hypothetical protein